MFSKGWCCRTTPPPLETEPNPSESPIPSSHSRTGVSEVPRSYQWREDHVSGRRLRVWGSCACTRVRVPALSRDSHIPSSTAESQVLHPLPPSPPHDRTYRDLSPVVLSGGNRRSISQPVELDPDYPGRTESSRRFRDYNRTWVTPWFRGAPIDGTVRADRLVGVTR